MQDAGSPVTVDVCFPVLPAVAGSTVPADHGFALYGAICRILPWVHADSRVGIHPISGRLGGNREALLTPRSVITMRVPQTLIPDLLTLAGAVLDVDGSRLTAGVPRTRALTPAASLHSRLVVIKGMQEADRFLHAAAAQCEELGIKGIPSLVRRTGARPFEASGRGGAGEWVRRTLRVKDRTIVGYAVQVTGLTAGESIKLQERGLGGRRRFGCGIFVPVRGVQGG